MKYFDNSIVSNPGSDIVIEYSPVVNEDGSIGLEESGKSNIQELIDSYGESCDIENIITRYTNGEIEVLNRNLVNYGDFTSFPKTYAEILQLQIDSNNLFNSLPVDIKEKFNNDANQFFVKSGTEEWLNILSPLMNVEKKIEKVESEDSVSV